MGLATRIIPTLLKRGNGLVKGVGFDSWRSVGHVRQAVRIHQTRGVDELIFLDISATPEGRGPDFDSIAELTQECFMPITVGGGVRSVDDVRGLLNAGADKVAICTAAHEFDGTLIRQCANLFGSQAIVVSVDTKDASVWVRGGTCRTHWPILDYVQWVERLGAGEILLSSVDRDGMMFGYELELISQVSKVVSIPVIASGGCGTYEHMLQAINAGASAVAAGAMFAFTDQTPKNAAKYLAQHGVEVRL